jgi:hypothetical protein
MRQQSRVNKRHLDGDPSELIKELELGDPPGESRAHLRRDLLLVEGVFTNRVVKTGERASVGHLRTVRISRQILIDPRLIVVIQLMHVLVGANVEPADVDPTSLLQHRRQHHRLPRRIHPARTRSTEPRKYPRSGSRKIQLAVSIDMSDECVTRI